MVKAGSGLATLGTSSSAGVPEALANETLVLPLNDLAALKACLEDHRHVRLYWTQKDFNEIFKKVHTKE